MRPDGPGEHLSPGTAAPGDLSPGTASPAQLNAPASAASGVRLGARDDDPPAPSRARAWLALVVLALAYAALRLAMNREFAGAPWDELLDFSAAKPFGLRVLVPLLAWPLHALLRVPTAWVFGLFEAVATAGLVLALASALRLFMPRRWATALGALFVLLLPVPFLLQHRWPIFYPYDTPAMAFTAGGVALLLRGRWRGAAALACVAALNRESAALLPAAAVALHLRAAPGHVPPDMSLRTLPTRQLLGRGLALAAAVAVARLAVAVVLRDNPGAPVQLFVDDTPRLLANLAWLETPAHWLRLPAYLGFLPLAWLLLPGWMPAALRRLGWVALAWLGALLWVANIDEPRVYGEAMVLLYIPVAVALQRWLQAARPAV